MELPKSFISKLKRTLPDLCSVKDLLKVGIYRSEQAAYSARRTGNCPFNFYFPCRGYVYPKESVIEFVEKVARSSSKRETRIKDAIISHSEVPPLLQNGKDMKR